MNLIDEWVKAVKKTNKTWTSTPQPGKPYQIFRRCSYRAWPKTDGPAGPTCEREGPLGQPPNPWSEAQWGRAKPDRRDPMIVLPKEWRARKTWRHTSDVTVADKLPPAAPRSLLHKHRRDVDGRSSAFKSSASPAGSSSTSPPPLLYIRAVGLLLSHSHGSILPWPFALHWWAKDMELSAKVYLSGQVDRMTRHTGVYYKLASWASVLVV